MISTKIANIRQAAGKATQGEWLWDKNQPYFVDGSDKYEGKEVCLSEPKNCVYIALANPSTMLQLLDYISDLEKCVGVQESALLEIGKPVSLDDSILTRPLDNMSNANESLTTVAGILGRWKDE
jgi:hypothetical protein